MTTPPDAGESGAHRGIAGRLAMAFVQSKLTPLFVLVAVLLGVASLVLLPREEEPQIHVPMVDVQVSLPGASARETEERATRPIEGLLWEVPGVEYVYSTSREEESLVIVRFRVGSNPDASLARVAEKLRANLGRVAPNIPFPSIIPRSIDDVPILALTLHGPRADPVQLRRLAKELEGVAKQVQDVAETTLIGGARRQIRIGLDPARLAARNLSPVDVATAIRRANRQERAGSMAVSDREVVVQSGDLLEGPEQVGRVVVGVFEGRSVRVDDVAEVRDAAEEPTWYVFHGTGPAGGGAAPSEPAVTLTIAKRPGANAITVATEVLRKVEALRGTILPPDVAVSVARNYGATAAEKSDELLVHMGIAVAGVALLVWLALGWREAGVVGIAIPATLALTLLVFLLWGFTLNRITLFALIFSIGILVDDAIVVVENIVRHLRLEANRGRAVSVVAVEAVAEVGNPTILATFAVIAAVLPMGFVGGLMGPYMRPIPVGAGAAMFWSLLVAFVVTPWAAVRILGGRRHGKADGAGAEAAPSAGHREDMATRLYRRWMALLLGQARWRWGFLVGVVVLLLAACGGVGMGWVKVKMLPFDNKAEFQLVLNMPEDGSLERTARAAGELAAELATVPEVRDFQIYVGTAAPFGFNGLVRHYFLRRGASVADIQVNLVPKGERRAQSHDIARRVRPRLAAIAARFDARLAVVEVPPGPPVLQTLVAEVYAPDDATRLALATGVRDIFRATRGVVDVDWYVEDEQPRTRFVVDAAKAALHGIDVGAANRALRIALGSEWVDVLHVPREREDVGIVLDVPRRWRSRPEDLLALRARGGDPGALAVPLRELVRVERGVVDRSRHRKNLMAVTYVTGDVAGEIESPVYAIQAMNRDLARLAVPAVPGAPAAVGLRLYNASQPASDAEPSMKWDGEWHVTLEVFRDLGLAFAAVLVLIYVLMVGWFRSFLTPLVVMAAIPFSLVGILPAHGAMGAFFTATSMIGFMAGAGIVVRNSIILVDFIEQRLGEGMALGAAVVDAGAVRFRPMLLTALAVVVGASVMLSDPIFQGLAISLMAGEIASLLISRIAVPVLYFMSHREALPKAG
ncbi:MAG: efflux RND transporter permease subunit [Verrucomicrobia bacterium]|nr:MAG: efflux RND transporter permease subunit [Verrucomicrobiota bacterium]